jgi:hypothetical protein
VGVYTAGTKFLRGTPVSIVRVGMSENNKYADGYDAIFGGKKKPAEAKKAKPAAAPKKPAKKKK